MIARPDPKTYALGMSRLYHIIGRDDNEKNSLFLFHRVAHSTVFIIDGMSDLTYSGLGDFGR